MIDTIVFDLDGTLLNTLDDLADSTNFALNKNGLKTRSLSEVKSFVGNCVKKLILRAVPDNTDEKTFEKVFADFTAHYDTNKENKTAPYDGITDMLKKVKAKGYKTAIVTNKYDAAAQELKTKLFPEIDFIIGERADIRVKPEPDGVNLALKELNSDKDNAVYVGDSDVDILTAKNAGLKMIAVSWGFRDTDFLIKNGAKTIIDTPNQIFDVLDKL